MYLKEAETVSCVKIVDFKHLRYIFQWNQERGVLWFEIYTEIVIGCHLRDMTIHLSSLTFKGIMHVSIYSNYQVPHISQPYCSDLKGVKTN